MNLTIDKMFEYDLGIDFSDHTSTVQNLLQERRNNPVQTEPEPVEFWLSLINEDMKTPPPPPPPKPPTPPPTRYSGNGRPAKYGGFCNE